ncbi:hypothetical protein MTR67_007315 [Solanum verrucosum]|uniref:Pectinesterase catalytic domain-containing protein n=1 Tax=Solanum verrucosum TaxID=315347 RepID=A0AAF0TI35_SOLVR|nr:hypothetical protein MTR67_007315 [Solanum verrucosum]
MDKTIIWGNKSYGDGIWTYYSTLVGVDGAGFMAQDITFRNMTRVVNYQAVALSTFGVDGEYFMVQDFIFPNIARVVNFQAVALRTFGQSSTLYRCQFNGFQDTLYTNNGNQFYRECIILGIIDFIFGDANVVLQNCLIEVRKPLKGQFITITTQ